ncbi:UNVERIFIED_CONTAM: Ankyrin repeat domain-containing protein, chloroplastic [Sesamum angustifolium]|uniref:Ankyrin repeat domain-containing protein, chloroplastic n=1 Tax=Sesamum angustifolium TaxID=2727405 RepID=A0AAW2RKJ5_9LAMI
MNRRIPDIAVATSGKWHPLHTLAASGQFYLVNTLLKHNLDINVPDKDGATLMHYAVLTASSHMIKILLLYNVDLNLQDYDGLTPLDLCLYSGRDTRTYELIKLLKRIP